jgi:hypothetical protein
VGRRGSGPAFGPVRLELCHVKAFWLLFGLQKVTKEKTTIHQLSLFPNEIASGCFNP